MANSGGERLSVLYWELEVFFSRQQAEREALAAGKSAGGAFDKGFGADDAGRKGAAAWVASLTKDLHARREDIKREAVAGLITPQEAAAAGRQAAAQYTKELRGGLDALRTKGAIGAADLPALLVQGANGLRLQRSEAELLAGGLNKVAVGHENVAKGAAQAVPGLGRVRDVFEGLIQRATDTSPAISRLSTILLQLGAGGLVATAVLGGAALIALFVKKIGESAREAQKKLDDLFESLARMREQAKPESTIAKASLDAASNAVKAAEKRIREIERSAVGSDRFGDTSAGEASRATQLTAARAQLAKATTGMRDAQIALNRAQDDEAETHAARIARLVAEGGARRDQIEQRKKELAQAREALVVLNAETPQGQSRRFQVRRASPDAKDAVLDEQLRLSGIIKSLEAVDKAKAKSEAADAKAESARQTRIQGIREQLEAMKAGLTAATDDNVTTRLASIDRQLKDLKPDAKQLADLKALRDSIAVLSTEKTADSARRALAAATLTGVDDFNIQIEDIGKQYEGATGKAREYADQLIRLKTLQRDVLKDSEGLAARLTNYEDLFNISGNAIRLVGSLNREKSAEEQNLKGAKTDEQRRAIRERIAAIDTRIAKAQDAAADANDRARRAAAGLESSTTKVAGALANAANFGFGLASALLGADSAAAKLLGSIGQLASGISSISSLATKAGGLGALFSSGAGIASALPGIGAAVGGAIAIASSLFGKDPAIERARQETLEGMRGLKDALINLRDTYLQNVSSEAVKRDIAAVEKITAASASGAFGRILQPGEGNGPGRRGNLRDIGRSIGQDFDSGALLAYFKEMDRKYGTNLASFIEREDPYGLLQALRQVPAVLKQELSELGKFGDDVAGVIERINYEFGVLGKSDPLAKFRATIKALESAKIDFGDFADELAELADAATSPERVQEIIASVLSQLNAGGGNLGGLTAEEVRGLLSQGADARRTTAGGTGGFNIDRSITEVTGSRIGAMLTNISAFTQRTAEAAEALARLSGVSLPSPLISPPSMPSVTPAASGAGGLTVNIEAGALQITLAGAEVTEERAKQFSEVFTDSMIAEIDRKLGGRIAWKKRAAGNIEVS